MSDNTQQRIDPRFGQQRVFALDDPSVDPAVVAYLGRVRQEALTTNAISRASLEQNSGPKHTHQASMYDDVSEELPVAKKQRTEVPSLIKQAQKHYVEWNRWLDKLQVELESKGSQIEEYTDEQMNALLSHLKRYIEGKPEKKGIHTHLLNLLREHHPTSNSGKLPDGMDEEWSENLIIKLGRSRIPTLDILKTHIMSDFSSLEPRGYKAWAKFVKENEPSRSMFHTMIHPGNIWLLVKYMSERWIDDLISKANLTAKLSYWLLYTLLYLPTKVTATNTSTLRDLGKKCRDLIVNDARTVDTVIAHGSAEMVQFEATRFPADLSVIQLALARIATTYGQQDLFELS
ncbi:Brr1p KNAG_0H00760 [Huiozyma naganishii CBS 8797]|uniref:Pre-mRNA-splicing factor BRR1 n=1 Tax=Huiozyma naganishii (strain ATCC MYA-139 / BCRC 22969 / CBS 8797 / KCTC 17520 / NBRC 10181 / NCYC 3082 / Yp74L-3) TaxID=1071383 RepID=J7S9H3_HUIN7|nr:hypothetical protein KNAG_0H00760 [Kazachstania naganishii CBS 8797]CCK71491.1 hypothetical protein KNAG_0H00760 [Kazachstania naganishii CBS 8797]